VTRHRWQKGRVTIRGESGAREVDALVCGPLAVHATPVLPGRKPGSAGQTVAHVATGGSVLNCLPDVARAKAAAEKLLAAVPDLLAARTTAQWYALAASRYHVARAALGRDALYLPNGGWTARVE
jgi:hypothetical protein